MENKSIQYQDTNDELDLRELWATLVKRKLTIIAVTMITTISAACYAYISTPIYNGEVLIEIGEVIINSESINDKPTIIREIENRTDTIEAVRKAIVPIDERKEKTLTIDAPKGSGKLIRINYESPDKLQIRQTLNRAIIFVLKRHELKLKLFQKANAQVSQSKIVGAIEIESDPIKPKKALIITVAFISGLMLGIFVAFFIEFISNGRKADETPEMNKE